jgi:uncharacterized protein
MSYEHLGKGWQYPFSFDIQGNVSKAEYHESINSAIMLILDTRPGELFMMPHIGCRLWELVFHNFDEVFLALAEEYIKSALYEQEPRISDILLLFTAVEDDPNTIIITLRYRVISTGFEGKLDYAFTREGAA